MAKIYEITYPPIIHESGKARCRLTYQPILKYWQIETLLIYPVQYHEVGQLKYRGEEYTKAAEAAKKVLDSFVSGERLGIDFANKDDDTIIKELFS